MNMDDLLNALGQASGSQSASGGQPDLGSLLGALSGGQQGGSQPDLGGLLGGLLGGSAASGSDPLSGLLGGLLGGGQSGAGFTAGGSGSPLDALIMPLAQKLGIAPEIAGLVANFLLNALISGKMAGRSGPATAAPQGGMDLGDAIAGFGGKASRSGAASSQLVRELSQETGLDEKTAAASIDEFVNLLGGLEGLERVLGAR